MLPPQADAAREIEALAALGGRLIAACEADFPQGLAALAAPPPLIAVLGNGHLLRKDMVAIVGARNASALSRKFAQMLARDLADAGLCIVSGMARGIDAAAHDAALDGGTVAVLAGGVDVIYPRRMTRSIAPSPSAARWSPKCAWAKRPTRGISPAATGLSRAWRAAWWVVEAAERSGSLITANYALEQGREIFAVPGSPLDPPRPGRQSPDPRGRHPGPGRRGYPGGTASDAGRRFWRTRSLAHPAATGQWRAGRGSRPGCAPRWKRR